MSPESPRTAAGADAPAPDDAPGSTLAPDPERVQRTCPVCGAELAERKCKLYCARPGCGYFLSCADFY
jgi:hypothetical protein